MAIFQNQKHLLRRLAFFFFYVFANLSSVCLNGRQLDSHSYPVT